MFAASNETRIQEQRCDFELPDGVAANFSVAATSSSRGRASVTRQYGTQRQPNMIQTTEGGGFGYYSVQTEVKAALTGTGNALEGYADPYRACRFGVSDTGAFKSSLVNVQTLGGADNGPVPPLPRSVAPPVFFCTEAAPILSRLLTETWAAYDSGAESKRLVLENGLIGGSVGGTIVGIAGAAGLKVGIIKGFLLGGIPGAVGGGVLGGLWGLFLDQGLSGGRAHDTALAEVLDIYIELLASPEGGVRTQRANDSLAVLLNANQNLPQGTPFRAACAELTVCIERLP